MAEEKFLFKDIFNKEMVCSISNSIEAVYNCFNTKGFENFVLHKFPELEYKERSLQICLGLEKYLPKNYLDAVQILNKSLPKELPQKDVLGEKYYENFYITSYGEFIARNGLDLDLFNVSMNSLKEQTKRLSSEFAIRPFINKYPNKTLNLLKKWATDENIHVRRLVSEGSRPRLPWGIRLQRFIENPAPVVELLHLLKDDSSSYVRRSVANSLNDIAKDNPNLVTSTLESWQNATDEMNKLTAHALRTLVKNGDQKALSLCGFGDGKHLEITNFKLNSKIIQFGNPLEFSFKLKSYKKDIAKIMVDYIIYYPKANGKLSPKVYKLSKLEIKPKQFVELSGKRDFKPISTRKFYSGSHKIVILVNGSRLVEQDFELKI